MSYAPSLDLLASLNSLHHLLGPPSLHSKACLALCLDDQRLAALPLSLVLHTLTHIGFTRLEVEDLLLEGKFRNTVVRDFNQMCARDCGGDLMVFAEKMRRRLAVIREEGLHLNVGNAVQTYKFLVNWEEVVEALDGAEDGGSGGINLYFEDKMATHFNKCNVSLTPTPSGRNSMTRQTGTLTSGTVGYLRDLFGHTSTEDSEAMHRTMRKIPHYKDVPMKMVVEAVAFLKSQGFTNPQLEAGFPILFYSRTVLERALVKAEDLLPEGWREGEDAMRLLNYVIELEGNFTFGSIYVGIAEYFKKGRMNDLETSGIVEDEVEDHDEEEDVVFTDAEEDELEKDEDEEEMASSGMSRTPSQYSRGLLSRSSPLSLHHSQLSTSSPHQSKDDGPLTTRAKVFVLQSPLTRLRVWLKFREVQQAWDPSLDQDQVVAGAQQAVLAIVSRLGGGQWRELRGLLSRKEHKRLQREVETQWTDRERASLDLEEEHLLSCVVTEARSQQIVQCK